MNLRYLLLVLLLGGGAVRAQDDEANEPVDDRFTITGPISLDFTQEEEPINTPKKKKVKKKVFYGIKTRKGFTRSGYGERVTYELFYYLKKPELPKTFVRDLTWFDFRRREVRTTSAQAFKPEHGVLLHGPYEKRQGEVVLVTGIYYKGTKHGRWMYYNRDSVLTNKEKYFRGWPRESVVSYYDPAERTKMREITPIQFGEKDGYYYRFFENGQLAVVGEYRWDRRVGDWTEYYPNKKRKKIIAYPKDPFDKGVRPFIRIEWNEKGKEIYRNRRQ